MKRGEIPHFTRQQPINLYIMYVISKIVEPREHTECIGDKYPILKVSKKNPNVIALFTTETYGEYIMHQNENMILNEVDEVDIDSFKNYRGELILKNMDNQF